MSTFRLALLVSLALAACKGKGSSSDEGGDGGGDAVLELYPPKGGQGQTVDVSLSASRSLFQFGATEVEFGDGVIVNTVDVDDGWGARANVTVEADAALGLRDVTVHSGDRDYDLLGSFEVISESFEISPARARIGETVAVDMVGHNTQWEGGVTWPSFGDGVTVQDFTILSETLAEATLSVDTATAPGWRNVVMDNGGGDLVTLYDGFQVDRVALAATFDPVIAEQGETVEFTIKARGTDFLSSTPQITFFDRFGENPDIVVDTVTVLDAENLYGQMTLSNAAALGDRDVLLATPGEGVLIPDAFEVVSGDWNLEEVAIDLSFVVVREKDNNTGEIYESVRASVVFYIPLDPPCPTGGGSGSGSGSLGDPSPYDENGVWAVTGEGSGSEEDCPYPTTIPAGDYVWLESAANTITMDKVEDPSTGGVYYSASGLTFDDYVTNNWYDLHTQGQVDGIGEYTLPAVQPTVPADWQWLSPDLHNNYTHNRAEDFAFTWTPAMTYPDAMFFVSIWSKSAPGPMATENYVGYGAVIPWDDGSHQFAASEMSQFAAGSVPVYAYSIIQGPEFGLPESIYQENVAVSYIYLAQYMVLE
jgi:hypothetical protein